MGAPDPKDWFRVNLEVQRRAQKDILKVLKEADARIKAQLDAILRRPTLGAGDLVRREQMKLVQRNLRLEMSKIWRELGDVIQARRFEAAARTIGVGEELNAYLLGAVGGIKDAADIAASIASAEAANAASGLDRMMARMQGQSYRPLSQTVYNSSININGTVDRLVNTALARGLSARELASEVRQFINPNTPGGVRFASMRLARTEINNAAHAVAAQHMQDSPWIEAAKWNLSGSHPKPDVCDQLAHGGPKNNGLYPKGDIPGKPHPQCFCYITPELPSDDDFLDALVGGKYDDHLRKSTSGEPVAASVPELETSPLRKSVSSGSSRSRNLSGGAVADTRLVTARDGTKYVSKRTGKTASGSQELLGEAIRQQDAEVLASKVGKAFGVDVPEVIRISDTEIAMEFKQGKTYIDTIEKLYEQDKTREVADLELSLSGSDQGRLMGLFDQVIYNIDRHQGNFLLNKGKVSGIDHGYAFKFPEDPLKPVAGAGAFFSEQFTDFVRVPGIGGRLAFGSEIVSVAPEDLVELKRRLHSVRQDFIDLNHLDWYDTMLARIDEMLKKAKGKRRIL